MFVEFNDKTYMVKFSHTPYDKDLPRETNCCIFEVVKDPDNILADKHHFQYNGVNCTKVIAAVGQSKVSKEDINCFSKAFGRVNSLQRALRAAIRADLFGDDGNHAFKTFMAALNANHPNGMKSAMELMSIKMYTDPHYFDDIK